ncbi:CDP-glycerol glycerophosphotransferase family protein [Treponema sp.]|uniref:CDP-glycerol glycerophosphotransferase family protein n=1 Tax=Treponema sp. TaxID=166 RepID=UPI003F030AA2
MTASLLYIDPGTGSMLFSILIGATATLYFLARAAILKLKFLFTGKKGAADTSTHKYVIYNEDKRYWNVFKPVLDAFEKHGTEITYFTSYKEDNVFSAGYKFVKPEYIGTGNTAFAKLNLLSADIVLMTTPGLDVYQMKRSKNVKHYAHLEHSTGDSTMYRLFGIDYFDSVLVTGSYKEKDIRYLEDARGLKHKDIVSVGCTYLDVYKEKMEEIPPEEKHIFTVLVSPSWGPSAILTRYGEKLLDPLLQTGWNIIVRPHPQSKISESAMLDRLTEKYKDTKNLIWDYNTENIFSMKKADIMISDFSGIIYDYTFLCDKPVMYVNSDMDLGPYDAYDVPGRSPWQKTAVHKFGIELKEEEFNNIAQIIKAAGDSEEFKKQRDLNKAAAWEHQGTAGEEVYNFMVKKEEELLSLKNNTSLQEKSKS